jgi:glutamate/tyrosine decarboxylase-like PLP-dependent enzyme
MATSSLLGLDIQQLLHRAEHLAGTKFPSEVVEVTLEPDLNMICIRFKKPSDGELGEPAHPQVHLFKDRATNEVTAVELLEIDKLPQ